HKIRISEFHCWFPFPWLTTGILLVQSRCTVPVRFSTLIGKLPFNLFCQALDLNERKEAGQWNVDLPASQCCWVLWARSLPFVCLPLPWWHLPSTSKQMATHRLIKSPTPTASLSN